MKKTFIIAGLALVSLYSCKKDNNQSADLTSTEQKVLDNFVDNVAVPQYNDLAAKADALNNSIIALNATTNQANLDAARTAWLDMRKTWEQCEGFLFGPIEDNYYDPHLDTWPTDYNQMDSLLGTSQALTLSDIQGFTYSLRGFHPIEYIIFGNHSNRLPADITARQKAYMLSLSADVKQNCHELADSWSGAGNYGLLVKTAGKGSTKYATRREVFLAMADGLIDICNEVGTGKMQEPYASMSPQLVESPYSGNSVNDFKNNIIGLENVYIGHYTATGAGLSSLVAINNQSLDNKIRSQISAAISSFDNITHAYEVAIIDQRTQIQQTQAALATLNTTLENELKPYIVQYIKD